MKYAWILLLVGTALGAGEPRSVEEAEAQYALAVKVAQEKLIAFYKEEMKKRTQKGDLDGAVAIREKVKTLEIREDKINAAQLFLGKWKRNERNSAVFTINGDSTASISDGTIGKWVIQSNKLIVTWANGGRDELIIKEYTKSRPTLVSNSSYNGSETQYVYFPFDGK